MILVEVKVPVLKDSWDARSDEQETVEEVIKGLVNGLAKREGKALDIDKFILVWLERHWILSKNKTLIQYDVQDGDTLMLI